MIIHQDVPVEHSPKTLYPLAEPFAKMAVAFAEKNTFTFNASGSHVLPRPRPDNPRWPGHRRNRLLLAAMPPS